MLDWFLSKTNYLLLIINSKLILVSPSENFGPIDETTSLRKITFHWSTKLLKAFPCQIVLNMILIYHIFAKLS